MPAAKVMMPNGIIEFVHHINEEELRGREAQRKDQVALANDVRNSWVVN